MLMLVALVAGLVFGLGLTVAGMVNPGKVLGFLDFAGQWDPSLAFVLGGAVAVAFVGFRLAAPRTRPLVSLAFQPPAATGIDGRLLGGAAIFGLGWGLSGFCPGPAIAALGYGGSGVLVFVLAMLAGMGLFRVVMRP